MVKNSSLQKKAAIFSALGDVTRLGLVQKLAGGEGLSISELTEGRRISRQAVTKHLHVLEDAGLVKYEKSGRESRFKLDPKPLESAWTLLEDLERKWDQRLMRLKIYAENTD